MKDKGCKTPAFWVFLILYPSSFAYQQLGFTFRPNTMNDYHVRIADDTLVFSAAHFITLDKSACELLHGHNYRVAAEVFGPLDENQYVVDFLALRDALQSILRELDHCVLLPAEHSSIQVTAGTQEVEARFADRRWTFPRSDCRLLPLAATTAELLAQYIGRRLLDALYLWRQAAGMRLDRG